MLSEFGLDAEAVEADRDASRGLATAHFHLIGEVEDNRELRIMRILASATEARRAAAHSVLLSDWHTAQQMFDMAGHLYRAAGFPYGLMMFACSRKPLAQVFPTFGIAEERTQLAYLLLARAASGERIVEEMLEPLAGARGSPIGILGLPAGAYVRLALALGAPQEERQTAEFTAVRETLLPFIAAYGSAIAQARESDYWDSLALPFHPADPDTLGVLFCVDDVLRSRFQRSVIGMIESLPLSGIAAGILTNAIAEGLGREPLSFA